MPSVALSQAVQPRVLVVEDDPDVGAVVCDTLEEAGFDAVCVETEAAAYAALRQGRAWAALIVDVNLGTGASGFEVARHGRRTHPDLAVLYVSGSTQEGLYRAFAVADSDHLAKPFRPDELVEALRRSLARPR